MAKIEETQRGGQKLIYENFGYVKRRQRGEKITWNCDMVKKAKCNAYVMTGLSISEGDHIEIIGEHTHGPDPAKYDIIAAKNALKRRAVESMDEPAKNLLAETPGLAGLAEAPGLPQKATLERYIRRHRMVKRGGPAVKRIQSGRRKFAGSIPVQHNHDSNEDFVAAEAIEDISNEEIQEIPQSPRRSIPTATVSTNRIRTFGPIRQPQNPIGLGIRSTQTPDRDRSSLIDLERRVLTLKERALEGKLQLQRQKKAMYTKINSAVDKFDSAVDEFRRQVAEQRMVSRGADISQLPIDLPPGMRDILNV